MGNIFSRPAAAAALPAPLPTLTIRNLTITPLELKEAKLIERHTHLHRPNELRKVNSHIEGKAQSHEPGSPPTTPGGTEHEGDGQQPTKHEITIQPFSESYTPIYPPNTAHNKRLHLTFEDPATGYQYSAAIPGTSHRKITAIYFPTHAYLALFSSANLSSWMNPQLSHPPRRPPSVRCQSVPILTQLTNGVRFLDVRHPSETILLSLKREGTLRGTDADLSQTLHTHYILPLLAQCRGKIVLVRRYKLSPAVPAEEGGIDGSVWPDNVADGVCGSGMIRIQDYYGVGNASEVRRKVRFAQEGLERAAQGLGAEECGGMKVGDGRQQTPLFINFLSGSSFFNTTCWPDRIAVKINPSMAEYLCMEHGRPGTGAGASEVRNAPTGVVVIDYVGHRGDWDLVRCIVGWNARLQLEQ
ncbi:hypothetical protein N0V88_006387 [Collariella sp. IMI 366227]|nr:hypothetical protein N0V88_006387 [Collariella sp. IMI 366227]